MKRLQTAPEYAKAHGISRTRLQQFLDAGRVPGAQRIGTGLGKRGYWMIPEGAIVRRKKRHGGRSGTV